MQAALKGGTRRRSLAAALGAIAFVATRAAAAQAEPVSDAEPPVELEPEREAPVPAPTPAEARSEIAEVRIIGGTPDALQRVPGSGNVVTTEEIRRAQPFDVGEMLRRVPGVQARQEYGGGLRLDISIRGNEGGRSRRVLVLEDGVPISLNPYAEPDMYFSPPIERMRGIEVVKGSGSILFGPQTIGGVVNFLTLLPREARSLSLDAEGGQYGYFRGMTTYNDYFGSARYVVQALYRRGDGFREQPFDQVDVLAKMAVDTSKDGEAIFKIGFHNDSTQSDDVGLTREMFAVNPRRATLAPNDHLDLRRYDISLIHEQRITEKSRLKTLLYAYTTNRIWNRQSYARSRAPGVTYDYVVGDEGIPYGAIYFAHGDTVLDRAYEVAGVEPRFEVRFAAIGGEHTLDFGARVLAESAHYQQRTGDTPTSRAGSLEQEEKHGTIAEAVYAQDRIAFREWLLVTPGLRLEHADYERSVLRQGGRDLDVRGRSDVTGLIPGIGMVVGTKQVHGFGGVHVGWAPPRVTSSISPNGASAQLNEERSINYEAGLRARPITWLRSEGTFFVSKFDNQVVLNTAVSTGGVDATVTSETDGGVTRHVGTELSSVAEIGRLLRLGAIVDVAGRYTFSRATFSGGPNDGNILPYSPLHAVSANLDVEHPSGFGGQVAYNFVGPRFTDVANTVAEDTTGRIGRIPSYHVLDVGAHYRHKASGFSVRLLAKNALDDLYISARRPEGIFTSGFRQILLGVRWDYEATEARSGGKEARR